MDVVGHNLGRYRKQATNCLQIARNAADPNTKLALLDMAQVWIMLAEEAERNGGLRLDPVARNSSLQSGSSPN
jgi:hypothetical protein